MNLKKTAIALAVASVAAAPVVASADGSVYASARIGIQYTDTGGDDNTRVRGHAARFGMKGETDLGNGMTGWGKYEFAVNTERNNSTVTDSGGNTHTDTHTTVGLRHAVVGVKGDFGNIFLGQTYHTWYNLIVAPVDQPWWNSGIGMIAYRGRTDEGISYAGNFGAVSVGATAYMRATDSDNLASTEEDIDSTEIAVAFDAGPVRIGVGILAEEAADDDVVGITASGSAGDVYLAGTLQTQDEDSSFEGHVGFGSFYFQLGLNMPDVGPEPTAFTLGYTHGLGPRTTMWFEYTNTDADTGDSDDDYTAIHGVLKYDIL